ncbi:MAG: hypothetical protein LBT87_07905 [Treponema sp.]|jgi:hypothetical protein|nr:hypothetical protein [Treponema sp.]
MAIQPIDLQTLFTQIDKVGKLQASQKEGLALQQAIRSVEIQRRTDEHIQSVNEAQNTGQGMEQINDRNARKRKPGEDAGGEEGRETARDSGEAMEKAASARVIRDPALGRNIDFSG